MLFNLESGIHPVDHKVYKVNRVNDKRFTMWNQIWVRPNEVDKPRAYYTEQSKSEREI